MCKGGSRTTTTQQTTGQSQDVRNWSDAASYADPLARDPSAEAMRYATERARAGMHPDLIRATAEADRAGRVTQPLLNQSIDAVNRGAQDVNLNPLDVNQYYNPYASSVFANLNQNLGIESAKLGSANRALMGGVGGDRAGVAEALKFQQDQLARGQLSAQMWDTATRTAQQQQGAQYSADTANRANQYNAANAWMSQYGYGQSASANAARMVDEYGMNQWERVANMARSLAPVLGMRQTSDSGGVSHAAGTSYGTQTQTSQQDPMSQIAGLAMTGIGLAMGNPMMAMGGMNSLAGGSGMGGSQGYGGGLFGSFGGFGGGGGGGYATPAGWGSGAAIYRRGGRVSPWTIRKAVGGPLSWNERSEPIDEAMRRGIFMPRSEEDYREGGWPPSIPEGPARIENFNDRASPHIAALDEGIYDAESSAYNDFRGSEAMRASNAGVIPVPRPRPEEAGPGATEATPVAPTSISSVNRPSPLSIAATGSSGFSLPDMEDRYQRPKRNWSDFLIKAGLSTLAAGSKTEGGVPISGLSALGKGVLSAYDEERKDLREDEAAHRWRSQMKLTRQNLLDNIATRKELAQESRADRALSRDLLMERHREAMEERKRHNIAAEDNARERRVASMSRLMGGKPWTNEQVRDKARIAAMQQMQLLEKTGKLGRMKPEELAAKTKELQDTYISELMEARKQTIMEYMNTPQGAAQPPAGTQPTPLPTSDTPPPEAYDRLKSFLKMGTNTTLNNGQVWTLGTDGQPKRLR